MSIVAPVLVASGLVVWSSCIFPWIFLGAIRRLLGGGGPRPWPVLASVRSRADAIVGLAGGSGWAVGVTVVIESVVRRPSDESVPRAVFLPAVACAAALALGSWTTRNSQTDFHRSLSPRTSGNRSRRFDLASLFMNGSLALAIALTIWICLAFGWKAALVIPALLIPLLYRFSSRFLLWTRSVRPLPGHMEASIRSRAAAMGIHRLRLFVIEAGPSPLVNAFALPASGWILFSDDLLEALSPDEVLAVAGHELAHLTEGPRFWLRLLPMLLWAESIPLWLGATHATAIRACLPGIFLGYFVMRIATRRVTKALEERADRISAPGGPALASGLVKIHIAGLMPVRYGWLSTHPDLAERVSRLRGARGDLPESGHPAGLRLEVAMFAPYFFLVELPAAIYCAVRGGALLQFATLLR